MTLNESRIRRLILMSVRERELLRDWFAMADVNERDEDLIVILEALNDRARKLAAERQEEVDARERQAQRERERERSRATAVLS
jgi:hypothetical protein